MNFKEIMKNYQDDFINDLQGLVRIASIRDESSKTIMEPFGKACNEALIYMQKLSESFGFETENIDGHALLVSFGDGNESYGMLGHLDVVPISDGWNFEPFGAEIKEGFIIGRGVVDDKGPSLAALYAMRMLKDQGLVPKKRIMLILGLDEESKMECMEYYCKHAPLPDKGFVPDADFPVIYGEKGMCQLRIKGAINSKINDLHCGTRSNIVIAHAQAVINAAKNIEKPFLEYMSQINLKGNYLFENGTSKVEVFGEAAHAATPYDGDNAALRLLEIIKNNFDNDDAGKLFDLLNDWRGGGLSMSINSNTMGDLTMNLGIIHIAKNCVDLTLDFRFPQETNAETIIAKTRSAFAAAGLAVEITCEHSAKPLYIDPDSEFVQTLTNAYRMYSGDDQSMNKVIGGGTYAKILPNFVAFGPEFPNPAKPVSFKLGKIHQNDEAISLEELYLACAIYAQVLKDDACI